MVFDNINKNSYSKCIHNDSNINHTNINCYYAYANFLSYFVLCSLINFNINFESINKTSINSLINIKNDYDLKETYRYSATYNNISNNKILNNNNNNYNNFALLNNYNKYYNKSTEDVFFSKIYESIILREIIMHFENCYQEVLSEQVPYLGNCLTHYGFYCIELTNFSFLIKLNNKVEFKIKELDSFFFNKNIKNEVLYQGLILKNQYLKDMKNKYFTNIKVTNNYVKKIELTSTYPRLIFFIKFMPLLEGIITIHAYAQNKLSRNTNKINVNKSKTYNNFNEVNNNIALKRNNQAKVIKKKENYIYMLFNKKKSVTSNSEDNVIYINYSNIIDEFKIISVNEIINNDSNETEAYNKNLDIIEKFLYEYLKINKYNSMFNKLNYFEDNNNNNNNYNIVSEISLQHINTDTNKTLNILSNNKIDDLNFFFDNETDDVIYFSYQMLNFITIFCGNNNISNILSSSHNINSKQQININLNEVKNNKNSYNYNLNNILINLKNYYKEKNNYNSISKYSDFNKFLIINKDLNSLLFLRIDFDSMLDNKFYFDDIEDYYKSITINKYNLLNRLNSYINLNNKVKSIANNYNNDVTLDLLSSYSSKILSIVNNISNIKQQDSSNFYKYNINKASNTINSTLNDILHDINYKKPNIKEALNIKNQLSLISKLKSIDSYKPLTFTYKDNKYKQSKDNNNDLSLIRKLKSFNNVNDLFLCSYHNYFNNVNDDCNINTKRYSNNIALSPVNKLNSLDNLLFFNKNNVNDINNNCYFENISLNKYNTFKHDIINNDKNVINNTSLYVYIESIIHKVPNRTFIDKKYNNWTYKKHDTLIINKNNIYNKRNNSNNLKKYNSINFRNTKSNINNINNINKLNIIKYYNSDIAYSSILSNGNFLEYDRFNNAKSNVYNKNKFIDFKIINTFNNNIYNYKHVNNKNNCYKETILNKDNISSSISFENGNVEYNYNVNYDDIGYKINSSDIIKEDNINNSKEFKEKLTLKDNKIKSSKTQLNKSNNFLFKYSKESNLLSNNTNKFQKNLLFKTNNITNAKISFENNEFKSIVNGNNIHDINSKSANNNNNKNNVNSFNNINSTNILNNINNKKTSNLNILDSYVINDSNQPLIKNYLNSNNEVINLLKEKNNIK